MAQFPNAFAEQMQPLPQDLGSQAANDAARSLAERGFVVEAGITPYLAGAIGQMATQPHIVEYCPNEPDRYATEEAARRWVSKGRQGVTSGGAGRQVFGLSKIQEDGSRRPIGWSWERMEKQEELPDNPITFAIRLGQEGTRKGLALPFTIITVAGTAALCGVRVEDAGLESWKSNPKAIDVYKEAGFVKVASREDVRPTLHPVGTEIDGNIVFAGEHKGKPSNMVRDTRIFMGHTGNFSRAV